MIYDENLISINRLIQVKMSSSSFKSDCNLLSKITSSAKGGYHFSLASQNGTNGNSILYIAIYLKSKNSILSLLKMGADLNQNQIDSLYVPPYEIDRFAAEVLNASPTPLTLLETVFKADPAFVETAMNVSQEL